MSKTNVFTVLEENPVNVYIEGVTILLKLLDNIIREPATDKFRNFRKENKTIKEKLLCLKGAQELLLQIGFVEVNGDQFKLPSTVLIANLRSCRNYLHERLVYHKEVKDQQIENPIGIPTTTTTTATLNNNSSSQQSTSTDDTNKTQHKVSNAIQLSRQYKIKPFHELTTFEQILPYQNAFMQNLERQSDLIMQYEDMELQAYGRSLIPLATLTNEAVKMLRGTQKCIKKGETLPENEPCLRDLLLVQLCNWFNTKFFKWVDSLPCQVCGNEEVQTRNKYVENGTMVEAYTCCNKTSKFYRYSDIAKLLQTRIGRCGEFANCFTFFCRCLNYDARLICTTFDHVWTEVYSYKQKRWLHIDPSDNVIDAPLMYEHGWKRNVDYVIAFSRDDVQNVTNRYTTDRLIASKRNIHFKHQDLINSIGLLRNKRQNAGVSTLRLNYLKIRLADDLTDLLTVREPTENEKQGRSSGSFSWKLSRGENQETGNILKYEFTLLPDELIKREFNLRYSCAKDIYERYVKGIDNNIKIIKCQPKWSSSHYSSNNIFRKEERDWKMVYLARTEDTETAEIIWKFNFVNENLKINNIKLKFETKIYENGQIKIIYLNDKNEELRSTDDLKGLSMFSIKVCLSGGKGGVAWQHTQLFRQKINAIDYPFDLNINFM